MSADLASLVDPIVLRAERFFGAAAVARVREVALRVTGRLPAAHANDSWQRPNIFCPGITAKPWYDTTELAEAVVLEQYAEIIKCEFENSLRQGVSHVSPHSQQFLVSQGQWSDINLKLGTRMGPFAQYFPQTLQLLQSFGRLGEMALFSVLGPHSHIKAHCGPWNLRLTIHLGLAIPEHAFIRVGAEVRRWQMGRCLIFDDSFEHEVWNRGARPRVVLIVDVWHRDLTAVEISVLNEISSVIVR